MSNENSRIEKIIEEINSKNAKKVALVMVLCLACYHALLYVKYGANSCQWLLSDGRYKGDKQWQPYGCMLHLYTKIDTKRCLRYIAYYGSQTHFIFVGDSRIRQLYYGFINHMTQNGDTTNESLTSNTNLTHFDNGLNIKVEFFWAPFISKEMIDLFRNWELSENPPSVIVAGSAIWPIINSNGSKDAVDRYKINITRLVQPIDGLFKKKSRVLWTIQAPVNQDKLEPEKVILNNNLLDLYNKGAIEILSHSKASIWLSMRLIGQGMVLESPDGIHLADRPLRHNTQILLNMYCNDYMNFNDGTCCSSMESYTTLQIVTFAILAVCVAIASVMSLYRFIMVFRGKSFQEYQRLPEAEIQHPQPSSPQSYYLLFTSIAKLTIILTYFFICDRTNFFMKENKYYSEFSFWLPIGYVTVLGLFFTEDSKLTKILHRDQLNECKGWMQLVILVYHVTGASRILVINMHMKVLISAYLFLLGYEQFTYVWHRGIISIVSFFRTLFQLNFMTVTLCLCMNRPYQFYYFGPLLSFWYMMIYCFLAFPPHITAQNSENVIQFFYLLMKFICLFSIIIILFMSEVFFEKIFVTRPWKALFVTTDDDIHEWWFRWKLDRYSIIYGMCFSVILIVGQKYAIFDDNNHSNLFSKRIAVSSTLAAFLGLGTYTTITFLCRNELECSEIHSYVVFIPIISYIFLRNVSGILRTRYSSFFAWFGGIHLELFLTQYHIWLAADTHGVLVLIPGFPVLNLIVTTFIFVCVSHEINQVTKVLLPYAIPNDWRHVLRNFILFLAILVPIGISDGMF